MSRKKHIITHRLICDRVPDKVYTVHKSICQIWYEKKWFDQWFWKPLQQFNNEDQMKYITARGSACAFQKFQSTNEEQEVCTTSPTTNVVSADNVSAQHNYPGASRQFPCWLTFPSTTWEEASQKPSDDFPCRLLPPRSWSRPISERFLKRKTGIKQINKYRSVPHS